MAYRVLEVTLLSAKDLMNVNLITRMEVYAVATISGDPLTRQCTLPDPYGGRHPSWNATLRFAVPPTASAASGCLHVLLRAERALGDRDVGEVVVPLTEILAGAGAGDLGPRPQQFMSYHVRKVHRTETRGVLYLTYRLGPIIAPQTKADDPVVAYPVAGPFHPPAGPAYTLPPSPPPPRASVHVTMPPPPPQTAGLSPQAFLHVAKSAPPQAAGHVPVAPPPQASRHVANSPPPQAAGHVAVPPSPQAAGHMAKSSPPQAAGHVAVARAPSPQISRHVANSPPPQVAGHAAVPPPPQAAGHVGRHVEMPPPPKAAGSVAVSPRTEKNNGNLYFGMGLGAGLVGGLLAGDRDMMSDAAAYITGYRAGLADGGEAEL